jgi:hypothetical protein
MDEKIIDLRENKREFISLSLTEDGMSHISYYNKIVKDGHTQDFENEFEAWKLFQILRKALLL